MVVDSSAHRWNHHCGCCHCRLGDVPGEEKGIEEEWSQEGEEVIPVVCCVRCLLENPIVNAGRAECGCARGVHFKCD